MKIFQTHGADGLWHDRPEDYYNKASAGAKRILDTDCARFKYYEKLTGSFDKAMLIINTIGDMDCKINTPFYEPVAPKVKEQGRFKSAIEIIADERQRQIDKYAYSDDVISHCTEDYGKGELALAAASYLLSDQWLSKDHGYLPDMIFPWDTDIYFKPSPDDRIKELSKAGAMIVAEITRLQSI